MRETLKQIFWEDLKESIEFFIKNFREIIKRTWKDILNDFKYD